MSHTPQQIKHSPITQSAKESIPYRLDTAPWGGSPTDPEVRIYYGGADVSDDNLSGSVTVDDDYIVAPLVELLIAGRNYRLEFEFTSGGARLLAFTTIKAIT